jgi:putative membrane protein insertion efficiency factor
MLDVGCSLLIGLVQLYRCALSPAKTFLFGPQAQCRFTPSCSVYALQALRTHGAMAGGWLAAKRICRCHPWGDCGHDPVPPKQNDGMTAVDLRPSTLDPVPGLSH